MTVRELIATLTEFDPDALVVVPHPVTGDDDEKYGWQVIEEVSGDPNTFFYTDPDNERRGGVGYDPNDTNRRKCVTIW